MDQSKTIKYPVATPEVEKMLGLNKLANQKSDDDSNDNVTSAKTGAMPANLPVANASPAAAPSVAEPADPVTVQQQQNSTATARSKAVNIIKIVLPYAAIFIVGIFLYYFFFSAVNFNVSGIIKSAAPGVTAPQQTAIQQLESQNLAAYNAWVSGFYYDVTDPKVLDPNTDNSGNGLTNFEKYLLDLNPKSYDTLGLGMSDSQAISDGINPLTGQPLTQAQTAIISKYIDMEAVMNRLALYNMQNPGMVAGASINSSGNSTGNGSGSQNSGVVVAQTSAVSLAPSSLARNTSNVNTSIPGLLEIPDLKISVPIVWTQDPSDFDQDLQVGVVHYPGTAMPGQIGTTYIAGHSSNYVWAKGSYNHIFTHLDDLPNDASFQITVTNTSGQKVIYHYVATSRQQYSPTDQAQFANTGKSIVALSTCWPVGSTAKRLVIFGTLTQVEK